MVGNENGGAHSDCMARVAAVGCCGGRRVGISWQCSRWPVHRGCVPTATTTVAMAASTPPFSALPAASVHSAADRAEAVCMVSCSCRCPCRILFLLVPLMKLLLPLSWPCKLRLASVSPCAPGVICSMSARPLIGLPWNCSVDGGSSTSSAESSNRPSASRKLTPRRVHEKPSQW